MHKQRSHICSQAHSMVPLDRVLLEFASFHDNFKFSIFGSTRGTKSVQNRQNGDLAERGATGKSKCGGKKNQRSFKYLENEKK